MHRVSPESIFAHRARFLGRPAPRARASVGMMGWTSPLARVESEFAKTTRSTKGEIHEEIKLLAIDLAKRVFQLHGIDGSGAKVLERRLMRDQVEPFVAGLPAC